MVAVLGLDIGGANLKAAHSDGPARTQRFPLWKNPAGLAEALRELVGTMPSFNLLAVTMTGELCDCFETKRQGVNAILDAVATVADGCPLRIWSTQGQFLDVAAARAEPLQVAAANWHALATFACWLIPLGTALLIDIGSTTTDIVPLANGRPNPRGMTDLERLRYQELVYLGVRRTPLCALMSLDPVAAELFATTLDLYLMLDNIAEDPEDCDTADGRPATKACAHARLARMKCADVETFSLSEAKDLANRAMLWQCVKYKNAVEKVVRRLHSAPRYIIQAGSGEFLIPAILQIQKPFKAPHAISLAQRLGPDISQAACAHAVAMLAKETNE